MKISKELLGCLQDETDAPYEDWERPIQRTKEDEEFEHEFAKKYGFELIDSDNETEKL